MLILRNPAETSSIADPDIRSLVEQRFIDLRQDNDEDYDEDYDWEVMGYFVLVEPGDTVAAIEEQTEAWICSSPYSAVRYGEPGFTPCYELLEEHPCCYEMIFVPSDGDFGITLFIPKQPDVDAELLQFCQEYAVPAPEWAVS
jgi:hypothetical protein